MSPSGTRARPKTTRRAQPSLAFSAARSVPRGIGAVVVPVLAGPEPVPDSPVPVDLEFCRRQGFGGKPGQSVTLPAADGAVVVALGVGDPDRLGSEELRRAAAAAVRAAWQYPAMALVLEGLGGTLSGELVGQSLAEGSSLAAYQFDTYKSDPDRSRQLRRVVAVAAGTASLGRGLRRGASVGGAVSLARDLVNEPAGEMTPRRFARLAQNVGRAAGLRVSVLDQAALTRGRFGGLTGVAQGSAQPPRLVRLWYEPSSPGRSRPRVPTVALVGKGITFDSGGLSIKTAAGMTTMKTDMSGAAAVLGTMSVLRELGVKVRVQGIVALTENMPGPAAIKPGDVLRIRNGKTIEVLNTDAEGRLVLADALSLAAEGRPQAIVDLATLTGACVVALGTRIAGLMGNDERLVELVRAAGRRAGEPCWPLPLPEDYRSHIESEVADMKNIGLAGQAGALSAGLLLSEFVDGIPWAHLDIAGPARSDADEGYLRKGGTGVGVRTLLELLGDFPSTGWPRGR
jgi:leucyl aminopeptidase